MLMRKGSRIKDVSVKRSPDNRSSAIFQMLTTYCPITWKSVNWRLLRVCLFEKFWESRIDLRHFSQLCSSATRLSPCLTVVCSTSGFPFISVTAIVCVYLHKGDSSLLYTRAPE